MKDQINTIREALVLGIKAINHLGGARETMPLHDAMPALAQIEAAVGAQVPEIWKDVVGFEGAYQISSEGRLKNVKTDYILRSASLMGGGYVKADLFKDGARTQTTIHRLVAEAFLGNTEGMEVNHINGVKTDNRIANLEVVTRSENEQHSRDVLGRLVKPVIATNLETGAETEYASIEAAGRDGFEPSCVYRCVRADHRIHKGHKFRLKNPEQLHVKHFLEAAPVAQQYEAGDMASAAAQGFRDGVASVAQQPQARPDFADEWTGYLKDGETPFERFLRERKDLDALTKLYQRALDENERLQGQQPQAKPHKPLFADLIAQHPGLREELLEMDKQPQAEVVLGMYEHKCPSVTGHRGPSFVCQKAGHAVGQNSYCNECPAAPQQAETVPSDVVRDAERYRWLAARPNEWRLFRKHGKHKLPFRMMRDGDPWGQSFASADEAIDAAIAAQGAKT